MASIMLSITYGKEDGDDSTAGVSSPTLSPNPKP